MKLLYAITGLCMVLGKSPLASLQKEIRASRRLEEACDPGENGTVDDDGNCVCNEGFKTDGVGCLPDVGDEENRRRLSDCDCDADPVADDCAEECAARRRLEGGCANDDECDGSEVCDTVTGSCNAPAGEEDGRRRLEGAACDATVDTSGNCVDGVCGDGFKSDGITCSPDVVEDGRRRLSELKVLSEFSSAVEKSAMRRLGSMPATDKQRLESILGELVEILSQPTERRALSDDACCDGDDTSACDPPCEDARRRLEENCCDGDDTSACDPPCEDARRRRLMDRLAKASRPADSKIQQ